MMKHNVPMPGRRARWRRLVCGGQFRFENTQHPSGCSAAGTLGNLMFYAALCTIAPAACNAPDGPAEAPAKFGAGLNPDLQWLADEKVRGIWIGGNLYDPYPDSERTKGQVLAAAGFNLVVLYNGVSRNDRNTAPDLEERITRNMAEARKHGLRVMGKWQYGSTHHGSYRKYREGGGTLHELTCCPLDEDYIERHVGRWAVRCAELGADGFVFDTEMYESDVAAYPGPCFCDACFGHYLRAHHDRPQATLIEVKPERRGRWINEHGEDARYGKYSADRVADLYAQIRARCQAINPAYLLGYAPFYNSFAGLTAGLGTATNPCLIFSEQEYTNGPSPQSLANVQHIRSAGVPALYLSGLMVHHQPPQMFADNALLGARSGDGWWAWYGSSLLSMVGGDDPEAFKSPYGRSPNTTAAEYHEALAVNHRRLAELIDQSPDGWPAMTEVPPPPKVDVPRRAATISIDGRLDESAWRRAVSFSLPTSRFGESTTVATTVRLCWDDGGLYVAYDSQMPQGTAIEVPETGRDNTKLWQFDGVEIFIAPGRSTRRYAQFMISPLGDVADLLVDLDGGSGKYGSPTWNTTPRTAATHDDRHYIIEAFIPFKDLAAAPKPGDEWGANFYRFRPDGAAWSPTYGGYHSPARFGTLRFVDGGR